MKHSKPIKELHLLEKILLEKRRDSFERLGLVTQYEEGYCKALDEFEESVQWAKVKIFKAEEGSKS